MSEPSKLEPALAALLEPAQHDLAALNPMLAAESSAPAGSVKLVHVLIKYTGHTADLEATGFQAWSVRRHPTDGFAIAAGPIPRDRLGELETIGHIVMVEGSRPLLPELNHTVPEIKADQLHSGSPSLQGAGVVVGIIDTGIDITHQCFRNPNGTTRIKGIWDQTLTATGTERPPTQFPGPGSGVEYAQNDIDATLTGTPIVRTVDTDGHGTHVAGIAAGDGSQSGNCRGSGTFVGVAPLADLLIVKVSYAAAEIGESINLIHAFDWIWNHSAAANKGVVINLSAGDNRGPHDGTSNVEGALGIDLLTVHGRAVVKSAGNEGASGCHAAGSVPAGGFLDVTFEVQNEDRINRHLELWYGKADTLSVTLLGVAPAQGKRPTSPKVGPNSGTVGSNFRPAPNLVLVTINSRTNDPRNGDNCIEINLLTAPKTMLPAGEWQLHLENPEAQPAAFNCWIDRGVGAPKFTSHATRDGTITIPGTSQHVITVGAYSVGGLLPFTWTGGLADFSSYGPTRDGRTKPDISAPGVNVTSVRSQVGNSCCCNCCVDFYTDTTKEDGPFSGTSMAAPHITGVVALMLEKDKTLDAFTIKQKLMLTARVPDGVNEADLPNSQWGAGKVNALDAVNDVQPPPNAVAPRDTGKAPTPGDSPTLIDECMPDHDREDGDAGSGHSVDLHLLARVALESPEGQHWAAVVSRHFSEVRGLINTNRRVATCWHRMDGPRLLWFFWHLTSSGEMVTLRDDSRLPDWRMRTARFLDVLERFGSPELRRDVTANRDAILALALPDLLAVLARSNHAA